MNSATQNSAKREPKPFLFETGAWSNWRYFFVLWFFAALSYFVVGFFLIFTASQYRPDPPPYFLNLMGSLLGLPASLFGAKSFWWALVNALSWGGVYCLAMPNL